MAVSLDQSQSLCSLRLDGHAGIEVAEELKFLLLQAVAMQKELRVDLQDVTYLDSTVIQLLFAAQRRFLSLGVDFSLVPIPPGIIDSLAGVGLSGFLVRAQ